MKCKRTLISKKYYVTARGEAFELKQLIILESRCVPVSLRFIRAWVIKNNKIFLLRHFYSTYIWYNGTYLYYNYIILCNLKVIRRVRSLSFFPLIIHLFKFQCLKLLNKNTIFLTSCFFFLLIKKYPVVIKLLFLKSYFTSKFQWVDSQFLKCLY